MAMRKGILIATMFLVLSLSLSLSSSFPFGRSKKEPQPDPEQQDPGQLPKDPKRVSHFLQCINPCFLKCRMLVPKETLKAICAGHCTLKCAFLKNIKPEENGHHGLLALGGLVYREPTTFDECVQVKCILRALDAKDLQKLMDVGKCTNECLDRYGYLDLLSQPTASPFAPAPSPTDSPFAPESPPTDSPVAPASPSTDSPVAPALPPTDSPFALASPPTDSPVAPPSP